MAHHVCSLRRSDTSAVGGEADMPPSNGFSHAQLHSAARLEPVLMTGLDVAVGASNDAGTSLDSVHAMSAGQGALARNRGRRLRWPLMGGPSERKTLMEAEVRDFADWLFRRAPVERAESRTAARLIDLWEARRQRGAEPLFTPSIGAAVRAGRPWLAFCCPGCGVAGEIDLGRVVRHPGASIESLIPDLSCTRCSPHPPFAKLIGLAAHPHAMP